MIELKEHIAERLDVLPKYDLYQVLDFVQYLEWRKIGQNDLGNLTSLLSRHNDDLLIGLFEGPPDLAMQAEDILQQAVTEHSGWTWKRSSQ